jgi:MYXO-CTERM domain-containing protein
MNRSLTLALAPLALAFAVSLAGPARADVPPPDACSGGVGTSCNNAGANADEPGVCANGMCSHASEDGGVVMEACVLCEPTDAGAGGSAGTGGGSSSTTPGGSSCAVGAPGGGGVVALAMAALALGALGRVRRSKR